MLNTSRHTADSSILLPTRIETSLLCCSDQGYQGQYHITIATRPGFVSSSQSDDFEARQGLMSRDNCRCSSQSHSPSCRRHSQPSKDLMLGIRLLSNGHDSSQNSHLNKILLLVQGLTRICYLCHPTGIKISLTGTRGRCEHEQAPTPWCADPWPL